MSIYDTTVGVYRNLKKGAVTRGEGWSIRAEDGLSKGRKVGAANTVTLTGVTTYVRESTRARLVAAKANPGEGKGSQGFREVHAWLIGKVTDGEVVTGSEREVTYRPFERGEFFYTDTGETFLRAGVVRFTEDGKAWASD